MHCEQCGEEVSDDAVYCSSCGTEISTNISQSQRSRRRSTAITSLDKFELGNNEEILFKKWGNRTVNGSASGGRIHVTNHRFVFKPHIFNINSETIEIPLSAVEQVGVRDGGSGSFWDTLFGGGLRSRLQVITESGEEEVFVVNGLEKTIKRINEIRTEQTENESGSNQEEPSNGNQKQSVGETKISQGKSIESTHTSGASFKISRFFTIIGGLAVIGSYLFPWYNITESNLSGVIVSQIPASEVNGLMLIVGLSALSMLFSMIAWDRWAQLVTGVFGVLISGMSSFSFNFYGQEGTDIVGIGSYTGPIGAVEPTTGLTFAFIGGVLICISGFGAVVNSTSQN